MRTFIGGLMLASMVSALDLAAKLETVVAETECVEVSGKISKLPGISKAYFTQALLPLANQFLFLIVK